LSCLSCFRLHLGRRSARRVVSFANSLVARLGLTLALAGLLVGLAALLPRQTPLQAKQVDITHDLAHRFRFRILFGLMDKTPTRWDGTIKVAPGEIERIDGWLLDADDEVRGTTGWKISTRRSRLMGEPADLIPPEKWPVVETGIIVTVAGFSAASKVEVQTASGVLSFRLVDIAYGRPLPLLGGTVEVDRVPASIQLTNTPEEQDFPAVAVSPDGTAWMAYVQYTENAEYEKRRRLTEEPKDFSYLAAPPGGDQVFLMKLSNGRWSGPFPVSKPGSDVYRCALAVDGQQRAWVIWSQNVNHNFDLYARAFDPGGSPLQEIRLTTSPGPDIHPVAATDSTGRVWVAWQGFRGTNSDIFAMRQENEGFGRPLTVASTSANEWEPAIATGPRGAVTVAWDTYLKGDYDVYMKTARADGGFGPATLVAGSLHYEVRPSIGYDKEGRLWVAWEESDERWAKDFGAYATTGTGIYHSRRIGLRVFQGGRAFLPEVPPGAALLGRQPRGEEESAASLAPFPDPSLAKRRTPNLSPQVPPRPRNSFPRLTVDSSGRVWIAYRSIWPPLGYLIRTLWHESLACYDGDRWVGPMFVPDTDNFLDNRPALAALPNGRLLLIHSRDYRATSAQFGPTERFNNDLYASEIELPGKGSATRLVADEPQKTRPDPLALAEREAISRARGYRTELGASKLQLMRGEFHRHTEISLDGGTDGALIDMWRYALDAAGMDWVGNGDHDNGGGREYSWWLVQKTTDAYFLDRSFIPMFTYERSVRYPEGHRNVIFSQRGVRPLARLMPRLAPDSVGSSPDTLMLYRYLKQFDGVCASHSSATDMGTDWQDNDPAVEPAVEIYQGDRQNYEMPGAPRSNSESDSIGGWRPKGFVSRALEKGYRLGFEASSDHYSNHMSYCNVWTEAPTRQEILKAFKQRHIYGSTDNIVAVVRSGEHFMGDEFTTGQPPVLQVKLVGTAPFSKVHVIRDGTYVYSVEPKSRTVEFEWRDNNPQPGRVSYYYVRGEQQDGELVWASPMWIRYEGR